MSTPLAPRMIFQEFNIPRPGQGANWCRKATGNSDNGNMALPAIYVINLDRDTARMATIARNLAKLGLDYERIPAVLGKELPDLDSHFDAAQYPLHNHADRPRPGEVGCYLSHIKAMRRLLETDKTCALILEDDVELLPEARECLEALAGRDDWDMVKLFCFHRGTPVRVAEVARGRHLCVHLTRTTSTAAYMVNRRAAERLVAGLLPMREQIDHAHDRPWETGLRIRGLRPLVARLDETALVTTIEGNAGPAAPASGGPAKRSGRLLIRRTCKEVRRLLWGVGEVLRVRMRRPGGCVAS